jgi:hypothetical protein
MQDNIYAVIHTITEFGIPIVIPPIILFIAENILWILFLTNAATHIPHKVKIIIDFMVKIKNAVACIT